MSQIKLKHSGGNSSIIAAPSSNPASDVTFRLPNADGSAGQFMKTDGSGNLAFAAAGGGKVLQRVSTASTTTVTTSGSTVSELLNVSITPASTGSKILLLATCSVGVSPSSNAFGAARIYRGNIASGTNILNVKGGSAAASVCHIPFSLSIVDSPSTTSTTTYTFAILRNSSNTSSLSTDGDGYTLIALELAS